MSCAPRHIGGTGGGTVLPKLGVRGYAGRMGELASERVVVAAPMSFAGSAARIWKLTRLTEHPAGRFALGTLAVLLVAVAWTVILCWYVVFSLLLVPYRLLRRGSRKRKRQALQHREMMAAVSESRSLERSGPEGSQVPVRSEGSPAGQRAPTSAT